MYYRNLSKLVGFLREIKYSKNILHRAEREPVGGRAEREGLQLLADEVPPHDAQGQRGETRQGSMNYICVKLSTLLSNLPKNVICQTVKLVSCQQGWGVS